ncbi:hypothetical protein LS71_008265 [Helicobacter jaachi]|uniref:Uncharacterized protein n=1 Tax=Helicobacter jaachi TaxID=1677920 RepID=A0A4U8T739_9HELI|nr:hypothetical protein [Helicobacter jaachi]TLD95391.1 hypothetical protein LS71_008265 [Helicobacter jaachi]
MTILLNKAQTQEAIMLINRLKHLYEERSEIDVQKLDRDSILKEEMAKACNIVDKNGQPQPSKVKLPLVMALFDELYLDKTNKKEDEYATMETYRLALEERISKEIINSSLAVIESLNENNAYIKEVIKEAKSLDKETLEAIKYLAKVHYKKRLDSKMAELGIDIKPPKDNAALIELAQALNEFINKQ